MRTLIINGKDIAELGATLLTVDYGYSKVITYKDWLKGSKNPLFYSQDTQYTTATFKILVEAASRKELDAASSNLASLARKGTYKVSDSDWYIDGDITNVEDDPINSKAKEVTISIEGIKSQNESKYITFKDGKATYTPVGNCEVPARFQITMDIGYVNYFLTVNGTTYKINNTSTRSTLDINGIKGQVYYGGANKIEDYQAWDFPTLIGGKENTIEISGGTLLLEYTGRWM